jgi:EpsI family protein
VETVLRSRRGVRVLWHWYMIGDTAVAVDWRAKLLEARDALFGGGAQSALVVVAAEGAEVDEARVRLREFMRDGGAPLLACLAAPSAPACVSSP